MLTHSQQRADERYGIINFVAKRVLKDILNGKSIQIEENYDKYSRIFVVLYNNKFIRVVTDYQLRFVKTVLPLKDTDYEHINNLIKLIA